MSLLDDMTKHRVFVQRLGASEIQSIMDYMHKLNKVAKQAAAAGTYGAMLKKTLREVVRTLPDTAIANLTDIAVYEAEFAVKTYGKYFDNIEGVSEKDLKRALVNDNISVNKVHVHDGEAIVTNLPKKSLATAYTQFGNRKADQMTQIIKDGQVLGKSIAETHAALDEITKGLITSQATALALTAVNYSTNVAKSQVADENRGIIEYEEWVSVLEDGTCEECEDLSGTVAEAGSFEEPPIHWGCKCEVIPYVAE